MFLGGWLLAKLRKNPSGNAGNPTDGWRSRRYRSAEEASEHVQADAPASHSDGAGRAGFAEVQAAQTRSEEGGDCFG